MIPWDDFKLVKAVAQARSLAGAGEALGVNPSTIFRRLGALETRLSARLFERGRGGYALTPAGEEMVRLAARMDTDIVDFERRIAGRDMKPSGDVSITTSDTLFSHVLAPLMARFLKAYPDIRLHVTISNAVANLSRRDADIALRATQRPPETLVGRRLASIAWGVYGSASHPGSSNGDNLEGASWVMPDDRLGRISAIRALEGIVPEGAIAARLDTVMGLEMAIREGCGIGPLPCFIGDKGDGLKRLKALNEDEADALWLLTHPDLKSSARVRAFMDFAARDITPLRAAFEGHAPSTDQFLTR